MAAERRYAWEVQQWAEATGEVAVYIKRGEVRIPHGHYVALVNSKEGAVPEVIAMTPEHQARAL